MPKRNTMLKYEKEMRDLASLLELPDSAISVDHEIEQITLKASYDLSGQEGMMIIEANSASDGFDYYIYFKNKVKESRRDQVALLPSEFQSRYAPGRFEFEAEDGYFRWRNRVDFEESNPTALTIYRNVKPGWEICEALADVFAAVAFTKTSAADALAEYDAEQEENKKKRRNKEDNDDAPSEL
jgi:hypothetical protein